MTVWIDASLITRLPAINSPLGQVDAPIRPLDLGQLVQGRVLAVRGSQAVISLLGQQIAVESHLPLQVGQVLDLVVREIRPDRITLQVARETEVGAPVHQVITDQNLGDLLTSQRLPTDSTNLLIARTLIRNSMPITNALVMGARNALSFIDAPTAEEMDAAIYLLLKDLPVTPQSLELAKVSLLQPNNLGARVQELTVQLRELLAHTAQDSVVPMLPKPLLALAHQVLQDLPQLVPDYTQSRTFAALLPQVLDQIATPTESRLARLIETAATVLSGSEALSPPTVAKGTVIIESQMLPSGEHPSAVQEDGRQALPATIRHPLIENDAIAPSGREAQSPPTVAKGTVIIESQMLPSGEHPSAVQEDGRQALPATIRHPLIEVSRDFRQQLSLFNDELAQAATELPSHHRVAPLLQELQVTIREMLTMVEAEQLSNAGMPPPTQAQGYYAFHLPVAMPGQHTTETAEVRVYYHGGQSNKRVDPENAHLAFLLEMSRLGSVEVHVDLYQKHLRCRIECANREATDLFQESSSELQERLQEIGYTVDSIRSVISSPAETRTEHSVAPRLSQIDIRA